MDNRVEYREVDSNSRAGLKHTVIVVNDMPVGCTCESFEFGIKKVANTVYVCIHMGQVYRQIQRDNYEGTKPSWLYVPTV